MTNVRIFGGREGEWREGEGGRVREGGRGGSGRSRGRGREGKKHMYKFTGAIYVWFGFLNGYLWLIV